MFLSHGILCQLRAARVLGMITEKLLADLYLFQNCDNGDEFKLLDYHFTALFLVTKFNHAIHVLILYGEQRK